jgi:resuscitation-promoting factor RpfB
VNQAVSFGLLLGGGILLVSVFSDKSLADVVKGKGPFTVSKTGATLPSVASVGQAIASSSTTATDSGGTGATVHGLITEGDLTQVASAHGWNASELADWLNVIKQESNGTLTDTNPSSGAYGIAQFIDGAGEYKTYGGDATTVIGQLTAMANYIAQRYGTPTAAWAHEQGYNWY